MSALVTEHLPLLASAPEGIKKLRGLILELAVRGKLVPQDPNDEPASEVLKRLKAAEDKGKGKFGILGSDRCLPFALPKSWCSARFGEIARHNSGKTLDKGRNSGVARDYLTTSNLYWGRFDLANVRQMLIEESDLERCTASKGDLLICEGGEAGRAAVWENDWDVCFQNHVHRARFRAELNPYFYQRYFERLNCSGEISEYRKGVGISNMSGKSLASIVVPVPPVKEQQRIVAKVDELMALCDRLEAQQDDAAAAHAQLMQTLLNSLTRAQDADDFAASWQRLSAHFDVLFTTDASIDALKQTILQLAVMGQLVPQDHSEEPASMLLKRVAEAKAKLTTTRGLKKQKPLSPVDEGEKMFHLPEGWMWVRKAEVFKFLNGYAYKSEWFKSSGVRLLRNINVSHGMVNWSEVACISEELAEEYQSFALKEGDVVLTLDRPIISTGLKYAVISAADLPCLLLQRVAKIDSHIGAVNAGYLAIWLNSRFFIDAIDPGRSNGVPHISTNQVAHMPFALPPIAEQLRIVAKVDELMALCDQLKAQLNAARQIHEKLAGALVEQAVA